MRSNIARWALEAVTTFVSQMSVEEIEKWVKQILNVKLGELVYSDLCPEGYSVTKGDPNFRVSTNMLLFHIILCVASGSARFSHDQFCYESGRPTTKTFFYVQDCLWSSMWSFGSHPYCGMFINNSPLDQSSCPCPA
jgi:hypothetical protein